MPIICQNLSVSFGDKQVIKKDCKEGKIYITAEIKGQNYNFYYGYDKDEKIAHAENIDGKFLSTETACSYAGLVIGMFASSYGEETDACADFDFFCYSGKDER